MLIYGATVWTAAEFLSRPRTPLGVVLRGVHRGAMWITALAVVTAIAGAFVAGLRAGHMFNTFPLMAGRLVPPGYGMLTPWWRNLFENPAAAQFNHRVLAVITLVAIVMFWWRARRMPLPTAARHAIAALTAITVVQVGLGIATLRLAVPVALGVAHQAGAVLVITAGLLAVHETRG